MPYPNLRLSLQTEEFELKHRYHIAIDAPWLTIVVMPGLIDGLLTFSVLNPDSPPSLFVEVFEAEDSTFSIN